MKNQKSLTNKGFSLVELIIVVAIMAILIGVLAPQYLRYVEKSRLQKDNTAMSEIANVIKMSSADEDIIGEINNAGAAGLTYNFTASGGNLVLATPTAPKLNAELERTLGTLTDIKLTSTTYGKASAKPAIEVTVDSSSSVVKVVYKNFRRTPDADPSDVTDGTGGGDGE